MVAICLLLPFLQKATPIPTDTANGIRLSVKVLSVALPKVKLAIGFTNLTDKAQSLSTYLLSPEMTVVRFFDAKKKVVHYKGDDLGFSMPDKAFTIGAHASHVYNRDFDLAKGSIPTMVSVFSGFRGGEFHPNWWSGDLQIKDLPLKVAKQANALHSNSGHSR